MTDLTDWLREQISSDEERTRTGRPFNNGRTFDHEGDWLEPNGGAWHTETCGWRVGEAIDRECECGVPDAVLAQCEAHTKILDLYAAEVNDGDHGILCGLGAAVVALGLAYQHRPGYRPEWRP